jgi:hypothetical protein
MMTQMCPLPESDMYIPAWLGALHDAGLKPVLIIEDYTDHMPGALRLRNTVAALKRLAS